MDQSFSNVHNECKAPAQQSENALTLYALATPIPVTHFQEWFASTQLAAKLLELGEDQQKIVIDQIHQRSIDPKKQVTPRENPEAAEETSYPSRLAVFLKETFTFPPIDKERLHCEPCMREENEKLMHVAIGMISPLSKFKWLGSGFITAGKFLGEGKDAIVHAVKGNPDWVIKELKFGGAERAEMLAFYMNQLAADARLKVPAVTHLGDGRLLQAFVHGSPIANIPFATHQLAAQNEAIELASAARLALGMRESEEFIVHPPYEVGIDPSFANFLFDSEGHLSGWIDPLYSMSR